MQAFEYASPTTVKEAVGLLGGSFNDAEVLAGGTDILSLMKDYIVFPKRLVNIKGIKELGGISKSGGGVRIGAAVTLDELMTNSSIRSAYPSLTEAARGIGSQQIRNMGTVGGDLCQRTRCWYYRNGFGLLAMKDGKSMVENGQNEFHAIFHNGPAKFVSASSLGPALIALGATVKITGAGGDRDVAAENFFVTPTSGSQREVDLKSNEIVTAVIVPSAAGVKNATYEVRYKDGLDWPVATASVALKMKGNTVESARIVLGHVGPTPVVATAAAASLAGKTISESVAAEAGKAAVAGAKPLSGNAYKVDVAAVAVKRALLAAAGVRA